MKNFFNLKVVFFFAAGATLLFFFIFSPREERILFNSLGTQVEIKVFSTLPHPKISQAKNQIQEISQKLNRYNPNSEISLVNKMAGVAAVEVSKETLEIVEESLAWSKKTHGAFDISVGPLVDLWKKAGGKRRLPQKEELLRALKLVNFQKVEANKKNRSIKLKENNMGLDLGGAGKGFALKKARETLKKQGVQHALISCQSSLASLGMRPDKKPWKIALRHPRKKDKVLGYIYLSKNQSLSTSGDYEKFYLIQGKKFNHILNPKTGWPAEQCESVTVVCEDPFVADMASTSIFIMGPQEGLAFLEKESSLEGLIIAKSGKILASSGFKWEKEESK